jgi:hypothetical protein
MECDKCGGKDFASSVRLMFRDGQGTTIKPNGYTCNTCHAPVDTAKMVNVIKKKNAEQKIRDLEASFGS